MRSFTIRENDAGQRMDKFITKAVPLLPQKPDVQISSSETHQVKRQAV